jgi:hypothetical protein
VYIAAYGGVCNSYYGVDGCAGLQKQGTAIEIDQNPQLRRLIPILSASTNHPPVILIVYLQNNAGQGYRKCFVWDSTDNTRYLNSAACHKTRPN